MQTLWGTMDDFCPPRKHKDRWQFRLRWRAAEKGGVFSRDKKSWIGAYGLEPTPELYIQHTVEVFRGVWRVLRDDGTLFLNLGDTYNSGPCGGRDPVRWPKQSRNDHIGHRSRAPGLKDKDLCGIPWRVALALQADGWYLRQDIIWSKPNPMPESVTDRCTKAHEYLFHLTKKPRYFYDAEAIKEPGKDWGKRDRKEGSAFVNGTPGRSKQSGGKNCDFSAGRNKRSVWTVTTKACKEAHFATFPPKLIEPCILAGTSAKGCCPECGASWDRIVEKSGGTTGKSWHDHKNDLSRGHRGGDEGNAAAAGYKDYNCKTTGWRPTCNCIKKRHPKREMCDAGWNEYLEHITDEMKPVPCVVFDPFMGAGTTAVAAIQHGRNYVGTELSPEYAKIAQRRIGAVVTGVPIKEADNGQMAMFRDH